jgi:creatinine amidohydrolase
MDYPPNTVQSLYSPEDIFGVVLRARLDLLVRQEYRLIVVINGHGADNHVAVLDRLAAEYTAAGPARVQHIIAFVPDPDGKYHIGHADAVETSLMMALYPGSVDLEVLPPLPDPLRNVDWAVVDGPTFDGQPTVDHTVAPENDPRLNAAAETGEAILAYSAEWIAEQVRGALLDLEAGR